MFQKHHIIKNKKINFLGATAKAIQRRKNTGGRGLRKFLDIESVDKVRNNICLDIDNSCSTEESYVQGKREEYRLSSVEVNGCKIMNAKIEVKGIIVGFLFQCVTHLLLTTFRTANLVISIPLIYIPHSILIWRSSSWGVKPIREHLFCTFRLDSLEM